MKASFVLLVALCAMLALASVAEPDKPYAEPERHGYEGPYDHDHDYYKHEGPYHHDHHHKVKTFRLYPGELDTCGGNNTQCGESMGTSRDMFADEGKNHRVGVLYQTGLVAKSGSGTDPLGTARLIYWQSFRFNGAYGFGEGTIQTQGDDTAFDDPTFTNRAITGGTGHYTGVGGYVTRGGDPATKTPTGYYTFVLTNWRSRERDDSYGGYYESQGY